MSDPLARRSDRDLPPGELDRRALHLRAEISAPIRRSSTVAMRVVLAVAAAAAVATPAYAFSDRIAGLFTTDRPTGRPVTVGYLPDGWQKSSDPPATISRRGTSVQTILTSWHWPLTEGPAASFPHDGILISIQLIRAASGRARVNLCQVTPRLPAYPERPLPLVLPARTESTFEGAPATPEFRIFGRIDGSYNYEVRVDIRTRKPTARQRSIAARVVAHLRFPSWPKPGSC